MVGRESSTGWLTARGRVRSCRSRRTCRKAAPFGAQHHLWRFAAYQLAPSVPIASGIMPGAWAPSTSTAIPRASRSGTSRSTGKMSAVGLVTWLRSARRVRGVTAASTRSTTSSGSAIGSGIRASTTTAPRSAAVTRRALSAASYSWSVARSSSPGLRSSERSTVAMPAVAFGTKTRSSGSAPTKAPTAARAAASRSSRLRARNATGLASISARRASWASSTARGQAPNDPWFRKTTPGSRAHRPARAARGARMGPPAGDVGPGPDLAGTASGWSVVPDRASRSLVTPGLASRSGGPGHGGGSAPARTRRSPRAACRPSPRASGRRS